MIKSRALGKEEVCVLLNLIENKKVITSKATNTTNNRLKEDAWKSVAQEFGARTGEKRRPEQLRLKWENLKKAARKRNASIRPKMVKTEGGKDTIHSKDILDRVANILRATCSGFNAEFGGDSLNKLSSSLSGLHEVSDPQPTSEIDLVSDDGQEILSDTKNLMSNEDSSVDGENMEGESVNNRKISTNPTKRLVKKRRLIELRAAQIEKERAMAAYFQAKTENVRLQNTKLQYEIEELKKNIDKI